MKIKKVRIKNYKSIIDSGDCYFTNDITIFAGKNESGKTSILEALYDFNTDRVIKDTVKSIKNEKAIPEISVTFEIEKNDLNEIFSNIGLNKKFSEETSIEIIKTFPQKISISKNTQKTLGITDKDFMVPEANIIFKKIQEITKSLAETLEKEEDFPDIKEISKDIYLMIKKKWDYEKPNLSNLEKIYKKLDTFYEEIPVLKEQQNTAFYIHLIDEIYSYIDKLDSLLNLNTVFTDEIKNYIPHFILFNSFEDIFPNKIPFGELEKNEWIKDLSIISNLDINTIKKSNDRRREEHRDEVNISLNEDYQKFWTQDIAKLSISWDSHYLYFWIKEEGDTYEPVIRSKGRQWHLAFYIKVTARAKEKVQNIILIDEPGLFLHAKAQKDILQQLENSAKKAQIVFSTHSPYLIDPKNLNRIRLIHKTKKTGTKISNNIHTVSDKETFAPIFTAIGLDLSSGIANFSEKNSVIVEGISDVYYLNAFKKILNKKSLNFIFGGGAGNMPVIGAILHGWGCKVLYLYDNDQGKKDGRKNLKRNWCIPEDLILSIIDQEGDAIEDIFSKNDFKKYILKNKEEYNLSNSQYAKQQKNKVLLAKQFLESSEKISLDKTTSKKVEELFKKIESVFDENKK